MQRSTPKAQAVVSKSSHSEIFRLRFSLLLYQYFFFSASLSLDFQGPNVLLLPHHHKNNNNKKTTYRTGCVVRPPWTYLYDVKPFKAVVYR